jgi:GntR family transcriptional regulator
VTGNRSQPKYRMVEDYLRAQIATGGFPIDSLLPTEEALRIRFGISRATVRAALNNLQADGLIARSPAIGSRVLASANRRAFQSGWNSVEDLLQHTKVVSLHVKGVKELIVDASLGEETGFGLGRSVVKVDGSRWSESESEAPLCAVEIYFDALYNGIAGDIGSDSRPIADLIEERYKVRIERIRQEISATTLTPEVACTLSTRPNDPALLIRRWYSDRNGQMFQMTRTQYPAERFRYVVEFGRIND